MDHKPTPSKSSLLGKLGKQYSGAITPIALSALSAWLIVTGIKGLAGFTVDSRSAFADLLGIVVVIAVARWMTPRSDAK
ncbi:MAG: hypothetical protein H7244_08365 [Herminiimonas sp.]|nr:hypothetical protein [Herminiimonas sp.]